MREKAVVFGEGVQLTGILTEPAAGADNRARPVWILVNAGVVHRVGPNRLYVRLARWLASRGYSSLRFDLSGRGDSDIRRDGVSFLEGSLLETTAAMDYVHKTTGADRFVFGGICSGAINSLQAIVADSRVVAVLAIDAPAYPTPGYHLRRYASKAFSLESWVNVLRGDNMIGRWLRGASKAAPPPRADEFAALYGDVTMPPKAETAAAMRTVLARGGRLLFVYSGSWSMYNYRNQFRDAFPDLMAGGGIDVEYFPDADHTFTHLANQWRLIETIGRWLARVDPAADVGTH